MITIKMHDEGDVFDVTIEFDQTDGFVASEFSTKSGAEDFARRAVDLFADVDDVQLVRPRLSAGRPGNGEAEQPLLRH